MKLSGFEERISEAFEFASIPQIADKMGVNYHTLRNWLKGRTDFPTEELAKIATLTDYSLNWILTGLGEKRTAKPRLPSLLNEDNLASFVRGIVQSELTKRLPGVQELGNVDEFDLAAAVEKYDNGSLVLADWYRHDGLTIPDFVQTLAFSGWEDMSLEDKVGEIKAARKVRERQAERRSHVPPKNVKHS